MTPADNYNGDDMTDKESLANELKEKELEVDLLERIYAAKQKVSSLKQRLGSSVPATAPSPAEPFVFATDSRSVDNTPLTSLPSSRMPKLAMSRGHFGLSREGSTATHNSAEFLWATAQDSLLEWALGQIQSHYTMRTFALPTSMMRELDLDWPQPMKDALHMTKPRNAVSGAGTFATSAGVFAASRQAESKCEWNLLHSADLEKPWMFRLKIILEGPLSVLLTHDLLDVLDQVFARCQMIFHSYHTIVELITDPGRLPHAWSVDVRQKRVLGQKLKDTIEKLYSIQRGTFERIIADTSSQIVNAQSQEEMERHVRAMRTSLAAAVDTDHFKRDSYVHSAIEKTSELINDFRVLVDNDVRRAMHSGGGDDDGGGGGGGFPLDQTLGREMLYSFNRTPVHLPPSSASKLTPTFKQTPVSRHSSSTKQQHRSVTLMKPKDAGQINKELSMVRVVLSRGRFKI